MAMAHTESSGNLYPVVRAFLAIDPKAPDVPIAPRDYVGMFENEHGERWVSIHKDQDEKRTLIGQDVGWESHPVERGRVPDLILNGPEIAWVKACWEAAMFIRGPKSQPA
jgi:hypothetical protein